MKRLALALLLAPFAPPATPPAAVNLDIVAAALVERMQLEPGERVLLVGAPGAMAGIVPALRARIAETGAVDLGAVAVEGTAGEDWSSPFTDALSGLDGDALVERLRTVDLAVMLPGAQPLHAPYAAMQQVLREGSGRTIHFHWEGAFDLAGDPLPVNDRGDTTYQRALVETDYVALAALQSRLEEAMRAGGVRVTTPAGTDLSLSIGDRPVTRQDGDASAARALLARNLIDREVELPAGAVRVAPLEESVEGTIVFPSSVWDGVRVRNLRLRFEAGTVTGLSAESGADTVEAVLQEAGPAARSFRELAVGLNPLLAVPDTDPWIPYYGYGAGVVRLSLGDNSELGGAVTGGWVRWNFFTDATVRVGDEVWIEDGRLIVDEPGRDAR